MRQTPRWFLGAVLLLCLAAFTPAQHRSRRHSHAPKSAGQLRKDLENLRSQKQKLRQQLKQTRVQTTVVVGDIAKVDADLGRIQDELDTTTTRLEDSREEQKRLVVELKDATKKLDDTREQVRKRLRHIYVHGNSSSISALVGTKSVGDIASRRYLLQMIAKKDRQLFTEFQRLRNLVAQRKARQDRLVIQVRGLVAQEADQKSDLQDKRHEKSEVLQTLKHKQGELQEMLRQFESDERDIAAQIAAFSRRKRRPGEKELPKFTGRFMRPVNGPITSGFGMRFHPILHITRLHAGIDFGVPRGTPIRAPADGEVIAARYSTSYGNMIILDHGGGITTVYAHCSRLMVGDGQVVHRGQQIAASGATGLAAGPHLHWEVRVNGRPVNPIGWF